MAGVTSGTASTVQPMGIDLERFTPHDAAEPDSGPLRVLAVNRLVSEKGVEDIVLRRRPAARRRGVPARVAFVGDGPLGGGWLRSRASRGSPTTSCSPGRGRTRTLPELYRCPPTSFVLASESPRHVARAVRLRGGRGDGLPGLPVLAGHSGSLPEVVAGPDSLVVPHDPFVLADRLEQLAADPDERRRQGARDRVFAEERYDRRRVRAALSDLYSRVLDVP